MMGMGTNQTVNGAVWYKTCSTARTHGFILICPSSNLTKAAGTSIDVRRAFREVIR